MYICSATTGLAVEDRYLIISCERAKVMELHTCLCKMFSEKRWNVNWTENSDIGN